jgi:hypothetical protein
MGHVAVVGRKASRGLARTGEKLGFTTAPNDSQPPRPQQATRSAAPATETDSKVKQKAREAGAVAKDATIRAYEGTKRAVSKAATATKSKVHELTHETKTAADQMDPVLAADYERLQREKAARREARKASRNAAVALAEPGDQPTAAGL